MLPYRIILCGLLFLPFWALDRARAEAGPPLLTDDPGTPEKHHAEINFAFTYDKNRREHNVEAPLVDANYGLMDHLQLKIESPYQITQERNPEHTYSGAGPTLIGLKGRFLDAKNFGVDMSIYPQVQFNGFNVSEDGHKIGEPAHLLLPLQFEKKFKPLTVGFDFGFDLQPAHHNQKPTHFYGIALGHEFTSRFELLGELHGTSNWRFQQQEWIANGGFRFKVNKLISLLGSAGTVVHSHDPNHDRLISYFGVQFHF